MTTAIITGGAGFVGSHLTDYLLEHTDWDIHILLRWQDSVDNIRHLIPRINDKDRVHLHYGDLNDAHSLNKIIERVTPKYIFHLAAQSYPKTSFDAPVETLGTNIIGTCNLLEALRQHSRLDQRIHICSSSEIFGRVARDKLPIAEDCSLHPASPYAISKIGTDMFGQFYAQAYGMHIQTTRMFTHTGPRRGDVFAESSFAKQIAMIEAGLQVPIVKVGNLNSLRTWADVRDAVRAYHMLLTVSPEAGAVYNIGGNYSCTVGEMLNTLLRFSTCAIGIEQDETRLRPIDCDAQVPDVRKFTAHTGWVPEIPFERTMLDLLEWWRAEVRLKGAFLQR